MLELFTPAAIAALSASQFVITELSKGAASEAGKKLVVELWDKLKEKFEKNDKATKAMLTIEKEGSQKELNKLAVYIDDEMQDSPDFATELHQLVQKIINSDKSQQQTNNDVTTANVSGSGNIGVLNNSNAGDVVLRDKNTTNNNTTNNFLEKNY
jgi:flavin-dependent dehydrogenase